MNVSRHACGKHRERSCRCSQPGLANDFNCSLCNPRRCRIQLWSQHQCFRSPWLDSSAVAGSALPFFRLLSMWPRSRSGSMMFRTRFFNSFVSGKPPSVLRSQMIVSVGLRVVSVDDTAGLVVFAELLAACVIVTQKFPPVTGTKAISPMPVLNV